MAAARIDKKPHICPPSTATHPSDRWETMFVYSFITKFTNLRGKVEGLDTPMDLETALLSPEASPILVDVLSRFIRNLRPQTRNLNTDQISSTVATVMLEYLKGSERSVFWDDTIKANLDPFHGVQGGFFGGDWDFKLKILRQLVELQLCHSPDIKAAIDGAWGVVHNKHKKKDNGGHADSDTKTQESLQLLPIGQDLQRKRFWVADDSPRVYTSTNPWKITATFQTVTSTLEEYTALIDELKAMGPPELKKGERRTKLEQNHLALVASLEGRIPTIEAELARIQRVRRRIENKRTSTMLAELRETRTRRQTRKPDYVYTNENASDDDADEYVDQGDENYDEEFDEDDFLNFRSDAPNASGSRRGSGSTAKRRSTRNANKNANGKREASSDAWEWRGERRSTRRLGGDTSASDPEPPYKRARTEDSMVSANSVGDASSTSAISHGDGTSLKVKTTGAAAVKPTEVALEQFAGRKKSKFWYYAVEPVTPSQPPAVDPGGVKAVNGNSNGYRNGHGAINGNGRAQSPPPTDVEDGSKSVSSESVVAPVS